MGVVLSDQEINQLQMRANVMLGDPTGFHRIARIIEKAAIEADRQARGEPIVWVNQTALDWATKKLASNLGVVPDKTAVYTVPLYLSPQPQQQVVAWLDMKTAPKDGTAVLVLTPDSDIPKSVRWRDDCWEMTWDGHQLSEYDQPRYWMPCPSDPDAVTQPQQQASEPVAYRWRQPIVDNKGITVGYTDWIYGDQKGFLDWWPHESLYTAPQPPQIPEGYKLVPIEPTPDMIAAARLHHEGEAYLPVSLYKAMLEAAPKVKP